MHTDTRNKILAYIREKGQTTPNELWHFLNISQPALYKQLKKLLQTDQISKIGTPPKVKYFPKFNMANNEIEQKSTNWAVTGDPQFASTEWLCSTRDVFQARQERLLTTLKNLISENLLYLIVGMVGEIGNNSFDHNLGNWRDVAGVLFAVDTETREIILSDRGQGILSTIKRVRPETLDDQTALNTAFTEIISGRAPEQRGNGLKFVKKIIEENNLSLQFYSGQAAVEISSGKFTIKQSDKIIPGSLAIIKF